MTTLVLTLLFESVSHLLYLLHMHFTFEMFSRTRVSFHDLVLYVLGQKKYVSYYMPKNI